MAWPLLALSVMSAGLAAYVGLDAGSSGEGLASRRVAALVLRPFGRAVTRLSATALVGRVSRIGCVARACDASSVRIATWEGSLLAPWARSREDFCAASIIAWVVFSLVASIALASPLVLLVTLIMPFVALPIWDGAAARRREQELAAEMPGVFRTLAMAMGAGETLAQAIDYVGAHEEGPAGRAFLRASLRLRCGISAEEALGSLAAELDAPGVGLLVTALLISQRTGSPLRELFQGSAALVERQGEFERMLSVKTAQVRLSVRVVSLLPAVLVLGLSLISPDFRHGLTTAAGLVSLGMAVLMDGAALLIIRSLMGGVL